MGGNLVFRQLARGRHWLPGWSACANEAGRVPCAAGGLRLPGRTGTFENWQSEFLQLMWQVDGLAFSHVGSPQSKEVDDRKEAKLDAILRKVDPRARNGRSAAWTSSITGADWRNRHDAGQLTCHQRKELNDGTGYSARP